jgi:hypothetical protein
MEISLQFHRYKVSDKVVMPRRDNGWTVILKPDGLSSKLAFVTDCWKSFLHLGFSCDWVCHPEDVFLN